MPRKPRIEYENARYHVINRGNYRKNIFTVYKTGEVFESVLLEACVRYDWKLFAYVVMSNHYHISIETEYANLSEGMQWLQSSFANAFSKFSRERGHVFQGRYKSLLIEGESSLLKVVNYIHLNPVRAGIVEIDKLKGYSLSSFPRYFKKMKGPAVLSAGEWLEDAVGLRPGLPGMRQYHKYLKLDLEKNELSRDKLYKELCRGWYIGTKAGKKSLLKDLKSGVLGIESVDRIESQLLSDESCEVLLVKCLKVLKKGQCDVDKDNKMADWKRAIAYYVKSKRSAKNQFFSEKLNMGTIYTVSRAISEYSKRNKKCRHYKQLMTKVKA